MQEKANKSKIIHSFTMRCSWEALVSSVNIDLISPHLERLNKTSDLAGSDMGTSGIQGRITKHSITILITYT
jgi:hypothetical protein